MNLFISSVSTPFILIVLCVRAYNCRENSSLENTEWLSNSNKIQFSWQVGIQLHQNITDMFCGGSLISDIWVLTAAHCLTNLLSAHIFLGTKTIYPLLEIFHLNFLQGGVHSGAVDHIVHEMFEKHSLLNDIALVKLQRRVRFNDHIQAIALDSENLVKPYGSISFSGWGKTRNDGFLSPNLKYIEMVVMSVEECRAFYTSLIDESTSFCALHSAGANICLGDSGGAAVVYKNNIPIHVGILSFIHSSGCQNTRPVGFTRTAFFRSWIQNKTGI